MKKKNPLQDFKDLRTLGVDVTNRVAVIRLGGGLHPANKVRNAQLSGANAVVLFSDPDEVAPEGQGSRDVVPEAPGLPGDGVTFAHVHLGVGDPVTPGWPSMEGTRRLDPARLDALPKIPVQPVSYDQARTLLRSLAGPDSPPGWKGGLQSTTYRLGGAFTSAVGAVNRAKVSVFNRLERVSSPNVLGTIRGAVEPDRYVVVGAHRDAWGPGAAEPNSATTALVGAAQALAEAMKVK